jgi:hypothetical protein
MDRSSCLNASDQIIGMNIRILGPLHFVLEDISKRMVQLEQSNFGMISSMNQMEARITEMCSTTLQINKRLKQDDKALCNVKSQARQWVQHSFNVWKGSKTLNFLHQTVTNVVSESSTTLELDEPENAVQHKKSNWSPQPSKSLQNEIHFEGNSSNADPNPPYDLEDGSSYMPGIEEICRIARLQKIHKRLDLFNPRRKTLAYFCKPLFESVPLRVVWNDFLRIFFGIEQRNLARGIEGSSLVHPLSIFNTCFESSCLFFLISTIFLVPLELSFWSIYDYCSIDSTLRYNMFVDVFFLIDLVYRFFVGVILPGGTYIDSLSRVSKIYFRSLDGFWFNLVTSIPFGWINWICILMYCNSPDFSPERLQNAAIPRVIKPIRALKLIRLLRVTSAWGSLLLRLNLSPVLVRAAKSVFFLVVALHVSACGFWRLKLDHRDSSESDDLEHSFLSSHGLSLHDVAANYVLCIYFMMSTFSTGDCALWRLSADGGRIGPH